MASEKDINRLRAFVLNAVDPNQSEEARRTYAMHACRLIHEKEILSILEDPKPEPTTEYVPYPDEIPDLNDILKDMIEADPFKISLSKSRGKCAKCGKDYIMGVPIAMSIRLSQITHFDCRHYFTEKR